MDTLELRLLPGSVLHQFTARDVISRWDVCEVHRRATSAAAALFLNAMPEMGADRSHDRPVFTRLGLPSMRKHL